MSSWTCPNCGFEGGPQSYIAHYCHGKPIDHVRIEKDIMRATDRRKVNIHRAQRAVNFLFRFLLYCGIATGLWFAAQWVSVCFGLFAMVYAVEYTVAKSRENSAPITED